MPKKRNYREEYDSYHKKPEQKKRRAERNHDRAQAEKRVGKAALKGKDVNHIGAKKHGSLKKYRTNIESVHKNRGRKT